jgi:hypothetical protein
MADARAAGSQAMVLCRVLEAASPGLVVPGTRKNQAEAACLANNRKVSTAITAVMRCSAEVLMIGR